MAVRPKVRTSNGASAFPSEELSCGYIMHQYKGIRVKMRWGQLWTGTNEGGIGRCTVRLFKYDIVNPKPGTFTKKDLREKLCFDFTEEDFCGLEKGEHFTRHGRRRYICIILTNKHLIVQDAITALTDADHDVIGTWYKRISETMNYINRWKVQREKEMSSEVKFLHISKENMCECYSLHNSSVGQKGKLLLDNIWKTKAISCVDEIHVNYDGNTCSRITFYDPRMDVKIMLLLQGTVNLSSVLIQMSKNTVCAKFDDLKLNPNLIKISPQSTNEAKKSPPLNLRQLSHKNRVKSANPYIIYEQDVGSSDQNQHHILQKNLFVDLPPPSQQPDPSTRDVIRDSQAPNAQQGGRNGTERPGNMFRQGSGLPPRHHTSRTRSPPPRPPRDQNGDPGMQKKLPDITTQTSLDSAYQTGDHLTYDGFSIASHDDALDRSRQNGLRISNNINQGQYQLENQNGPYVNVLNMSSPEAETPQVSAGQATQTELIAELHPSTSSPDVPPAIPKRDDVKSETDRFEDDLVERALRLQHLSPVDTDPDTFRPSYENNLSIEVTIGEIMNGNHREIQAANLGLPYSVYMALVLGLERDSMTQSNWRGLASALHMSFRDVEQVESAVHNHPNLLPAQILLLHWHRLQAPYPFTRFHLKEILSDVMGRHDLAALIQCEEETAEKGKEKN